MTFEARPAADSSTAWAGRGTAELVVTQDNDGWRVREQGCFTPAGATRTVRFGNIYRWQLVGEAWRLFHERFGHDSPVHLLDFTADGAGRLVAATPHLCGADRYHAEIDLDTNGFVLQWHIQGPAKHEHLVYRYGVAGL